MQVVDVIAGRIERGELLPNRPIPSENGIAQEFEVARGRLAATARQV